MKRFLVILLALLLLLSCLACAKKPAQEAAASIRVGSLKGPTSMGLVNMRKSAESGELTDTYAFTMVTDASELAASLVAGDVDIALIPANLAAVLYNKKTDKGIEVIDIRSLFPPDFDLIAESVSKTHKVIIYTEEARRGGYGGEISAEIAEELFDELDSPVVRIGALDTPIPYAPILEQYCLPCAKDIISAAKKMV